jgi:3-hydroxyisobutyrate dehydrogenase
VTSPEHGAAHAAPAPVVAVLGTGTMGAGMVRSLRRAGIPVRVWNRDGGKARALADVGAESFDSPAAAVSGVDVVITMLADADAVTDAIRRAEPAPGTVWLQTATVGIDGVERTIALARELGVELVDCPVQGTRKPAEDGALVLLASGSESARARLAPVFEALGRKTLWLGAAGAGSRLKLACNAWVLMLTAGVAQSIALARALGVDPQEFFEVIEGGSLDSLYARHKGGLIMSGEYPVSFALSGAVKDGRLIQSALRSADVSDRLMAAVTETLEEAVRRVPDPTGLDMGAVIEGLTPGAR